MGHLRSGGPWDTLALDYMGPFPKTERGNKYILVITDQFTKYVEVLAVPNQRAEDCASRLLNEFISRWGAPLKIHSDQGTTFESKIFQELCKLLEVRKTRTSPRNPQGNGQTERFNRTLLKMIKAYLTQEQEDWDMHLGCLAGAYRCTPNESTQFSPNMLCLGREVRLPADLVFPYNDSAVEVVQYADYVEGLKNKMLHAHAIARKYLKRKAELSKEIYDTKVAEYNYKEGDLVWCLHEIRKVGVTPKLEKRVEGPYVVIKRTSPFNFEIALNNKGSIKVVHHNKLKPYEGVNPPVWARQFSKKLRRKFRNVRSVTVLNTDV